METKSKDAAQHKSDPGQQDSTEVRLGRRISPPLTSAAFWMRQLPANAVKWDLCCGVKDYTARCLQTGAVSFARVVTKRWPQKREDLGLILRCLKMAACNESWRRPKKSCHKPN